MGAAPHWTLGNAPYIEETLRFPGQFVPEWHGNAGRIRNGET